MVKTQEGKVMAGKRYIVKRAALHCAERNPFRPSQKMKRGKWVVMGYYSTMEEAVTRLTELNTGRGLFKTAAFYGGAKVAEIGEYGRVVVLAKAEGGAK